MNIAELSIKKSVITWTMVVVLLVVGLKSYNSLARLEDPEFTIKEAVIITPYPGASAEEVAEEVTNVIEKACQELGQLRKVESRSTRGLSIVKPEIKQEYDKNTLPQVWDELRRKVTDYQSQLPPGAGPSLVNDDFGDVYGVYLVITGEGYTYAELWDFVEILRRELLLVQDVKKVSVYGKQSEVVWVEMSRSKMATLGISQEQIYAALSAKNIPVTSGYLNLGSEYIPINPTGEFKSEQEFGDLLISEPGSDQLVYLRDVADVVRGYAEPPSQLIYFDGQPGVGIGISTVLGGNVVTMGEAIDKRLRELEAQFPLGMKIEVVALQSDAVTASISSFIESLLQAIAIVVVVLLIFMGLRSGVVIGAVRLLTIFGTFIFMKMQGVILERISLGALIIALGMLVDNAIVVTDGMKVRMEKGMGGIDAAKEVVGQTAVPLLGATVVAVLAFAAIGTSKDSTGEYCRSLFTVVLISLTLSWVTAVTITPLLCNSFLIGKKKKKKDDKPDEKKRSDDPYGGGFYRGYRRFLEQCIRLRWLTVAVVAGIFVVSLWGFGNVKNNFFPDSTRPQFFIDFHFPEGTHIREVSRRLASAQDYVETIEGVEHITVTIGGSDFRFLLTYTPQMANTHYGQMLVTVDDYKRIPDVAPMVQVGLEERFPGAVVNVRQFLLGPGNGGKIQLRVMGPDLAEVRRLATTAQDILEADPGAKGVFTETYEKIKVIRPIMAEAQARRAGIDRHDIAVVLESAFSGYRTGLYREGEELLPIIARAPEAERLDVDNLQDVQIWSPAAQRMIPLRQVVTGFETRWEEANVWRRDRAPMVKVHADPRGQLPTELFNVIKPKIERALGVDMEAVLGKKFGTEEDPYAGLKATTIPVVWGKQLPLKGMPGYAVSWGGQLEDSAQANAAIKSMLPVFLGMMVLVVIFLFNSVRQPLVIWLTVPLAIIGVTIGLLSTKQAFGFMSILGLLSLIGMLMKNAIVLVDEINANIAAAKPVYESIVLAGVSRMRPVSMAALTTILGMVPLLGDAFFISMAVTVMFGLGVATVLTLIVVPVFYTIVFRVPSPSR